MLLQSTFFSYSQASQGGTFYLSNTHNLTLDNLSINGSTATKDGGFLYSIGSNSTENISTVIFKNTARMTGMIATNGKGGTFYIENAGLKMFMET